jgi:protein-disulfide isomerase
MRLRIFKGVRPIPLGRERGHRLIDAVSDADWTRGPADAPVTLVEYADYECPYCWDAHPIVETLLAADGDRVRFAFRHFPLISAHPRALPAAMAAEAAGTQGKFWQMHALLFEGRGRLADDDLRGYARQLGLDLQRFDRDRNDPAVEGRIRRGRIIGARSGVNGTPTFFINGERYGGAVTVEALQAAVRQAQEA